MQFKKLLKKKVLLQSGMALPMAIVISVLFTTILASLLARGNLFQGINTLKSQKSQNQDLARLQLEYFIKNNSNLCALTAAPSGSISNRCALSASSSGAALLTTPTPFASVPQTVLSIFYVDNVNTRRLISCAEKSNVAATVSVKYQCPPGSTFSNLYSFSYN